MCPDTLVAPKKNTTRNAFDRYLNAEVSGAGPLLPFPSSKGGPGLSIPKLSGSAWNNRGPVFGTNGPLVNGPLEQDYSEVAVVLVRFAMAQLDWRTWKIGLG
jgi:hypothetical protein